MAEAQLTMEDVAGRRVVQPKRHRLLSHWFSSLQLRMLTFSLLLALLPLAALNAVAYYSSTNALRYMALTVVEATANNVETAVAHWFEDEKAEALAYAGNLLLRTAVMAGRRDELLDYITVLKEGHEYSDAFVLDKVGKLIVSVSGHQIDSSLAPSILTALQGQVVISPVYLDSGRGVPVITVMAPISSPEGSDLVGVLGFHAEASKLTELLDEHLMLEEAEAFLVNSERFLVTQPRSISEPVVLARQVGDWGVNEALAGRDGVGTYVDESRRRVLVAYRWIDEANLAVIVKADESAILAGNRFMFRVLMVAILALGVLVGFAAIAISNGVARPIRDAVTVIGSAVAEVTASANQQASAAGQQAAAVSQVSSTMEELSRTAEQIAQNAENTLQAAETGQAAVQDTVRGMENVKAKVEDVARHILSLSERSQEIGEIAEIINDIANKTHLLALNASIEAAGAGEFGRRFGVVAGQVKELANETRDATVQVQRVIAEMRAATNTSIMSTEEATKEVERGSRLAESAGQAISEMVAQVETIALATQQQRTASEQVVKTMKEVEMVAKQSAAGSKQLAAGASQLREMAVQLQALVGRNGRV